MKGTLGEDSPWATPGMAVGLRLCCALLWFVSVDGVPSLPFLVTGAEPL